MARVPGNLTAASLGPKIMTRTIQCPQCGVVLNVPDAALGRKLKCPQCATKFAAPLPGPADSAIAEASPASSLFPSHQGPSSSGSFDLPTSPASLRETFELPFLSEDEPRAIPSARPATAPAPAQAPGTAPADVLALFQDEPKANRKLKGAESPRPRPPMPELRRRGAGRDVALLDLRSRPRHRPEGRSPGGFRRRHAGGRPPTHARDGRDLCRRPVRDGQPPRLDRLAGGLAKGVRTGMPFLLVVWLFGLYGARYQFLRRKSMRPMFLALSLSLGIGVGRRRRPADLPGQRAGRRRADLRRRGCPIR